MTLAQRVLLCQLKVQPLKRLQTLRDIEDVSSADAASTGLKAGARIHPHQRVRQRIRSPGHPRLLSKQSVGIWTPPMYSSALARL